MIVTHLLSISVTPTIILKARFGNTNHIGNIRNHDSTVAGKMILVFDYV